MILHPDERGVVAILQSAHALLAFQVAEHWGNRATPRPAPRADVLAAVLMHDAGWDGREEPPRLAADGRPLAFDTLPEDEREPVWRDAVERVAPRSRYAAYLVSHHVSHLAEAYSSQPHPDFLAAEAGRRDALRRDLERDPRYAPLFSSSGDAVNRAIVRIADAVAVHLARGARGRVTVDDVPTRSGAEPLEMREVGERSYRLRPWPLVGRRLTVSAEGRRLPQERFADQEALVEAWRSAEVVRLSWTLLAPGEPD